MPIFEITSPEGKTYEIEGPDGSTKEQAFAQFHSALAAHADTSYDPRKIPDQPQAKEPSLLDKIIGGGEAALSVGSALTGGALGAIGGTLGAVAGQAMNGRLDPRFGNVGDAAAQGARQFTYAPRTQAGQAALENVGSALDSSKLAGLGPTEALALGGMAPAVRAQAGNAAAPVIRAVAQSPEADALRAAGAAVGSVIAPNIKPEYSALARKAQALDIPLRPDMLTDNKFAKIIGEAFDRLPLSGSREDARQVAFNRAIIAQMGGDRNAQRLTPDVYRNTMKASGGGIGAIAEKTPIDLNLQAATTLDELVAQSQKFSTDNAAKIVGNYVSELKGKAADNAGVIPGTTYRKINSEIGMKIRTSTDPEIKQVLGALQDEMHDILTQNIKDPADLAKLTEFRKQYAIGKTIEPLVAKASDGNINPALLMGTLTNTAGKKAIMAQGGGQMGDLARIGQLFLKEPPTVNRALTYGLGLGGAGYIEPHYAAGAFGAANIYNRAGPSITSGLLKLDALRNQ